MGMAMSSLDVPAQKAIFFSARILQRIRYLQIRQVHVFDAEDASVHVRNS